MAPIFSSTRYRLLHYLPTLPFRLNDPQARTIRKSTTQVDSVDAHVTTDTHMDPSNDMGGAGAAAREELRAHAGLEGLSETVTPDEVYLLLSSAVTRFGLPNVDLTPLRAFADAYDDTLEALKAAVDKYCTATGAMAHSDAVGHTIPTQIELAVNWISDVLMNGLPKSKKGVIKDLALTNHGSVRYHLYAVASTHFKYKGLEPRQRVPLPPAIEMLIKVCFPGGGVATFTGFLSKIVGELEDDYNQRNIEDESSSEGEGERKRMKNV